MKLVTAYNFSKKMFSQLQNKQTDTWLANNCTSDIVWRASLNEVKQIGRGISPLCYSGHELHGIFVG
jgi:hypothetical protein